MMTSEGKSFLNKEEESEICSNDPSQSVKEDKISKKGTDKYSDIPTLEEKLKEDSGVIEDDFYDEIFIPNVQKSKKDKSTKSTIVSDSGVCNKSEVTGNKLFSDVLKGKTSGETNETNSHNSSTTLSCIVTNINDLHMITPVKKTGESENLTACPVKLSCLDSDNENETESGYKDDSHDDDDNEKPHRREYFKFESVAESNKLRKRFRDSSSSSCNDSEKSKTISPKRKKKAYETETNPIILARRQKQIDYGKNSVDYDRYIKMVPKQNRRKCHPKTPPKHIKYSRRAWDGLIKIWKQQIHAWSSSQDLPKSEHEEYDLKSELKSVSKIDE